MGEKIIIKIGGMSCANCALTIGKALSSVSVVSNSLLLKKNKLT